MLAQHPRTPGGAPHVGAVHPRRGLVVPLDGRGHHLALVGGKAANLDRLVRLEFRVPAAAAVTTAAYLRFLDGAPALRGFLTELLHAPVPGPGESGRARQAVDRAFLDTPLPTGLTGEILDAAALLRLGGSALAVRSSATSEDLAEVSFAGQHVSLLGVEDDEHLLDAVRLVWASLWHPAPRAYRARLGVGDRGLAMAVVLQRMVQAERSGVCFTSDPAAPETLRIETVDGLGEALVSGEVTPDVEQLTLPSLVRSDGTRPAPLLRSVARTALRVEEELGGGPQDVEWSAADDGLWVLQARPVTTFQSGRGDGFDTDRDREGRYTPVAVAEMLPGVLTPLLWTINGPLVEDGFRSLLHRLGGLGAGDPRPFAFLARFEGQAALNLARLQDAATRMGGTDPAEIERQYLGTVVSGEEHAERTRRRARLRMVAGAGRALRLRRRAMPAAEGFETAVRAVAAVPMPLAELRTSELLALRARVRDLAAGGVAAEIAVAVTAVSAYRALEAVLERWTGAEGRAWAQRITRDAGDAAHGVVGAVRRALEDLDGHELLRRVLADASPEDAEIRLRAVGPRGTALVDTLVSRLEELGSQSVYAGKTWAENRSALWQVVLSQLDQVEPDARSGAAALGELEARLVKTLRWRVVRVLTGQVVDVRRRTLRRLAREATELLSARERTKAAVLALGGSERRIVMALADRLVRRGELASRDDVELLADWELDEIASGLRQVPREELDRRRQALVRYRERPVLDALVDHHGRSLAGVTRSGDSLMGWGAGPGIAKGRVCIVRTLADGTNLEPGDVLVAPATDPSWTPLFLVAGAVVVERGGPLSHAAIVARELGIPAVLHAVGATSVLADGDVVEVDGTVGAVKRLEAVIS